MKGIATSYDTSNKAGINLSLAYAPEDGFLGALGDGNLRGELQGLPPGHHLTVGLLQDATSTSQDSANWQDRRISANPVPFETPNCVVNLLQTVTGAVSVK